jgi:hypothetical protein
LLPVHEVEMIALNSEQWASLVPVDPALVVFIELLEVFALDSLLE